jgi:hypothetical protein
MRGCAAISPRLPGEVDATGLVNQATQTSYVRRSPRRMWPDRATSGHRVKLALSGEAKAEHDA